MDINNIILAVASLGGMALLFGVALAYASQKFSVDVDPKVIKIRNALPGANCGACGFPGCDGFANAVANGQSKVNGCPVGGQETIDSLSEIMGLSSQTNDKMVARVLCKGGDNCISRFEYDGIIDCKAEHALSGGSKSCLVGCLGGETCVIACPFDAIFMNDINVAEVDKDKCTACGICIEECPRNIIELVTYTSEVVVDCINTERGGHVKKNCSNACIACKLCVKACPHDAIHVVNNIAKIDYDKCTNCGECFVVCPTKAISMDDENKIVVAV